MLPRALRDLPLTQIKSGPRSRDESALRRPLVGGGNHRRKQLLLLELVLLEVELHFFRTKSLICAVSQRCRRHWHRAGRGGLPGFIASSTRVPEESIPS